MWLFMVTSVLWLPTIKIADIIVQIEFLECFFLS